MRWALLALSLAACDESFVAPDQPDLYKSPIDFSIPGRTGGNKDMGMPDLAGGADFAVSDDLLEPLDFTLVGDHDLSQTD